MGFPNWTLFGMGLSALGALVALALALVAQSPRFLNRVGLGARFSSRAKSFTGYAFALLLLAIGFFVAGVPLGETEESPLAASSGSPSATPPSLILPEEGLSAAEISESSSLQSPNQAATPATGAFAGPPRTPTPGADGESPIATEAPDSQEGTPGAEPTETSPILPTPASSPSITPSATSTSTPTPTVTPSPTNTPTPIVGETAVLDLDGGTVWLRRSPGGPNLLVLNDNDIVLLLPGHANQGGILWREVSTLSGQAGWLPESMLEPQD